MYNGSMTKGGDAVRPDVDEALRYLGVRGGADASLRARMEELSQELTARISPRYVWRMLDVRREDGLRAGGIALAGRSAERMLADCGQCTVLVCTLGAAFDAWLRQLQARDMASAVMLDALGSAYVEAGCDAAEREIASRFPGMYLTDRFSPGYGDLPLEVQPELLDAAGARHIGVSCTPSLLLTPQKSVTALIGLADKPQMARIRGCDHCGMRERCTLRKAGTTCDV